MEDKKNRSLWWWYINSFRNYAVFRGRSPRVAYWSYLLFSQVFVVVLAVAEMLVNAYLKKDVESILTGFFKLAIILPGLALDVRRLHDIGRSGWWIFAECCLWIICLALFLFFDFPFGDDSGENFTVRLLIYCWPAIIFTMTLLIILAFTGSKPGENKYGPNPYEN